MNIKIYHNPRWSKSKESVKILEDYKKTFIIIEYIKEGLNQKTLNDILSILDVNPIKIIRTNDNDFKNLKLSAAQLEDKKLLIDILIKYPKIMQRPIIINKGKGVIGRPPENIYTIL